MGCVSGGSLVFGLDINLVPGNQQAEIKMTAENIETDKVYKRRSIRNIVTALLVISTLGFLAFEILDNPQDVSSLFNESDKKLVTILICLQVGGFLINAVISNLLLRIVHEKAKFAQNLKIAFMNEFGNRLLPIAGGSITSYIGYRRLGLSGSSIVFLETAWTGLNLAQYILFFLLSLVFVPKIFIDLVPKLSLLILLFVLAITATLWRLFFHKRKRAIAKWIIIRGVKVLRLVFPVPFDERDLDQKIEESYRKIIDNFKLFFSDKRNALFIFLLNSVYFAVDVVMLYIAFLTFEYYVPLSLVAFGMILSLLLSLITMFPSQPGVTETLFVLTFNTLGVPLHVAILSSILFRLTSYWLWLPLSTYFVFNGKKNDKTAPQAKH